METDFSPPAPLEVDDRFIDDWVAYGIAGLEAHLDRHARFADWCDRRAERS